MFYSQLVCVPRSFLEEVAIHLGSVGAFCPVQLKHARSNNVASVVEPTRVPFSSGEDQALPTVLKSDNLNMRK